MTVSLLAESDILLTVLGVGGKEGAFSMCTFWLVEALVRAGAYDKKYLVQAISLFENMLGYANHLHMFSEEIARSGEQLGNTPQAFSHLALIRSVIPFCDIFSLTWIVLLSTSIECQPVGMELENQLELCNFG